MPKLLSAYFLFLMVFFTACEKPNETLGESSNRITIICDMETMDGMDFMDQKGSYRFSNGAARVEDEQRSGKYSILLSKNDPFGLGFNLKELKHEERLEMSVWLKGDGFICVSGGKDNKYYQQENTAIEKGENGWKRINLVLEVSKEMEGDSLKVYVWNPSEKNAFFDDLKISRIRGSENILSGNDEMLYIYLNDKNFQKIRTKRNTAIKNGILITEDDDWVKGILFSKEDVLNGRFRLKGDRLDHLKGNKWSYRIKVKGENAWKGMKTFSVQTPAARNFLHEWFFHKALEKEDLLCTGYGFIPVNFNGNDVGLYAWEEHFEKQLLESRGRREGPILKITDDSYWILDMLRVKKDLTYSIPFYDAGNIVPFGQKKVLRDSLSLKEFLMGRDLYHQYKYATGKAEDLFDIELMAKYYAIIDASNAYHTLHFFNQRFYFNPVTGKLEPIFYDSFANADIYDYYGSDLLIEEAQSKWINIHLKLFSDKNFKDLYFKYLEKYTAKSYWQEIFREHEIELMILEKVIREEYPDYAFDVNIAYEIADKARVKMNEIRPLDQEEDLFGKFEERRMDVRKDYVGKADFELLEHLVVAYKEEDNKYRIENYSTDSIFISGFSNREQLENEALQNEIMLPPANSGEAFSIEINTRKGPQEFVFFKVRDQKLSVPVLAWPSPNENNIHKELRKESYLEELIENGKIIVVGDSIIISAKLDIARDLVIPQKWVVKFKKGSQLDLREGATFISYGQVLAEGSKEQKIIIGSSDKSGKGFNVFSAKERSMLKHCVFKDLAHLDYGGWHTTGAICFYESDVDIEEVEFESNVVGDDLLNIIRSDYHIQNCIFRNANADAFDSDFCSGLIENTSFIQPGNDAIDFSGSDVKMENCNISEAGDKGISCGEGSALEMFNCQIDGAYIGLASKDRSIVHIFDSEISNVTYGLVSFCKKPEYGPAKIIGEKLLVRSNLMLHLIEKGSYLEYNKREIFGQEKDLAKKFY